MGEPIYFGSCLSRKTLAVSGGTETSKYPEERKSTETPLVAASERGSAQTGGKQFSPGLWDSDMGFERVAEWSGKAGHRG